MRSLVRVGLRPSRHAKLSFGVQLMLVFFWIISALFLILAESYSVDQNYFYYVFLVLAIGYLIYILAQNTSIFGTQAYFEITPAYIVQKQGHFKPKIVIPLSDVAAMHISALALRLNMKDGTQQMLDLRLVRKRKNLKQIKEHLRNMALKYDFDLTEGSINNS